MANKLHKFFNKMKYVKDTLFKNIPKYENHSDLICFQCGGNEFNVAHDDDGISVFARCPKCKWETCIHC